MPTKLTPKHHWLVRYAAALAAVGAGFLLRLGLTAVVGEGLPTYITFYPVIMVVALFGGFGPGLLATFTTALGVDYWILPPEGFGIASLVDAVGLAFFSGMGIFTSAVAELYRRARQKAAAYEQQVPPWESREERPQPLVERMLLNGGMVLSLAILAAAGWQAHRSMVAMVQADRLVTHTYVANEAIEHFLMALQDMDSSVRGYLVTGKEQDLRAYTAALPESANRLAALRAEARDNPAQTRRVADLEALVGPKLAVLKETIELRRTRGLEAAQALLATGKGQALTEQIGQQMAKAQEEEERLLQERTLTKETRLHRARQALLSGGVVSFLILAAVFVFLRQENLGRRRAEAELRRHRDYLQEIVATRTAELGQANASLRRQREWLHVTLSSIGDAVLATDSAGHITFLNPVGETLTGWTEKEALGQPVQSVMRLINEETRAPGEDIAARVLREGQVVALANHTALLARDGREVPIEDSAAPIRDSAGTVSGVVLVFHDVTEKRRAQAAMREGERQFRTLADSIPNLAWWANADGYITWYNRRWYEYTGTTPQQMEGWGWQSVHDPRTLPSVLGRWKVSIATGQPFGMTFPLRGADGVFRPFLTRVVPLKDAQGRVQQWFGTNTDVSEQIRAEETEQRLNAELRQRVAELQAASEEIQASRRAALSLAEDAIEARTDAERVNAELQKANESLGSSRHAALNLMDDAVRARHQAEQAKEELQRLNRTLTAHSKSDQALIRNHSEADFLQAVCRIVVEECGHAMVWVGLAEDDKSKTVRPVAQAGFEEGYLGTLCITWDGTERGRGPTGTAIRTGGPSMCRNMLTDPEFGPWRAEAIKRGYASSLVLPLLAEGRAFGALTIYSRQPDGFSDEEVRLLTELAGDLAFGITAIRLRTAKERAEEALRKTAADLKRSNRDLEQFAYVASHDLQEPLRAVGGYVKLLEHRFPDKLDAKARGYIAGAFEGATRMECLIGDLLAFSRVATRGDAFLPADLEDALGQALSNLEAAICSAQAIVAHDPLPTLSVDAGQIRQLFQNLIGNAIKFHGEQAPKIHIGAQRQAGRWVFSVRDNGIGIDPQYNDKIFQVFQRLHTRKDYPGTGIGLAICKKIVERHGGAIWVESQPGQGATFYFSIPDAAAASQPPA